MPPVRGELCSSGSPIDWICPNLAVAIRVTSERAESEELRSSRAVWHAIPWSQQSPRVWQETTSDDFARGQDSLLACRQLEPADNTANVRIPPDDRACFQSAVPLSPPGSRSAGIASAATGASSSARVCSHLAESTRNLDRPRSMRADGHVRRGRANEDFARPFAISRELNEHAETSVDAPLSQRTSEELPPPRHAAPCRVELYPVADSWSRASPTPATSHVWRRLCRSEAQIVGLRDRRASPGPRRSRPQKRLGGADRVK